MSMPLQRVAPLRRRTQPNVPVASYWLRRVLDDDMRRRVHRAKGAGRQGRSLQCTIALYKCWTIYADLAFADVGTNARVV